MWPYEKATYRVTYIQCDLSDLYLNIEHACATNVVSSLFSLMGITFPSKLSLQNFRARFTKFPRLPSSSE